MIIFENVSFAYGRKKIFNNLNLTISSNMLTCLLGRTGCGKTTILRLIAGLETPSSGKIYIHEKIVADSSGTFVPPSQRNVGLIFQDLALWPHFTVYDNVAWGLKIKKDKNTGEKVLDMLDLFGIRNLADRYPHQLSGGQQQLTALARSLAPEPKALLMDEPFSNLDSKTKSVVLNYVLDLKKQFDITLVYVTHDNSDAGKLADDIILLAENGEVAMSGKKESVLESEAFNSIFS